MKKQTAVEWVVDKLSLLNLDIHLHPEKYNVDEAIREKNKILQQAKAMERQQTVDSYLECWMMDGGNADHKLTEANEYYNKIYGGER
jgi:hypothetical protein